MKKLNSHNKANSENLLNDAGSPLYGFVTRSEEEKLIIDIHRADIEKLQLFTRMLRRNAILKRAVITHKS